MTPEWALSVALHKTRHRMSEPGWSAEPCGACQSEARSLVATFPDGWGVVDLDVWCKDLGSKTRASQAYQLGIAVGAAQERERLRAALLALTD